ncbi:thioredoxin [Robiginitomaculum antarcticum]|uniref:thioredoxin n=1 Tax=Robiginitomaculum antarcticum TaxID=437507 RepID=UPI0003668AD0|nr:thioredoxin [Robiginitomaculum antarcticum]
MNDAAPVSTDMIKDTDTASFAADVIEASKDVPVIVDFWAPWCGPCKQLMPVLERVVRAQEGKVKMVKVNIDDNQELAGQMRVQSIPAVFAFKDGQPVDGFMGGQPESELKKFVARLTGEADTGQEAEALFSRAMGTLQSGDIGGAAQDLAQAIHVHPEHTGARAALARVYLESGGMDEARALLTDAPEEVADHPDLASVRAALDLRSGREGDEDGDAIDEGEAQADPAVTAALAKVEANPDDLDARLEAAKALAATGDNGAAMDHCLYAVAKNRAHDDEAARKFLLTLFQAEGSESELARDGRARLSSILFA